MVNDDFEAEVRLALVRCAEDVPLEVGDRLRNRNYHEKRSRRHVATGLAAVMVAVGIGGALIISGDGPSTIGHPASGPRSSTAAAATSSSHGLTMRLADATIPLPAGFNPTEAACLPAPGGLRLVGWSFGAAASSNGACFGVFLARGETAPAGGEQVNVGEHPGYVSVDASTGVVDLFVQLPANLYLRNIVPIRAIDGDTASLDLVVTAEGLSVSQVVAMAATEIPTAPLSPVRPCTANCG